MCFHMSWQGTWGLLEGREKLGLVFLEYLVAGFSDCMYSSLDIILQQNSFGLRSHSSFHWLQIRAEILIEQTDQRRSWKWFSYLEDGNWSVWQLWLPEPFPPASHSLWIRQWQQQSKHYSRAKKKLRSQWHCSCKSSEKETLKWNLDLYTM